MRIQKRNRIIATIGIALMILLITAGCGSNKNSDNESGVTDEAAIVLSNEESTANTEYVASEGTLETTNISEKYIADYNSYDEFIEDIKNLLDVMEESGKDAFFDRAQQYEWFTYYMWLGLSNDNFGYLQVDIDGDGVDELLLGNNGSEDNSYEAYINKMYTIRDDKVVPVFESYSESNFYGLCEDGVVKYVFNQPHVLHGVEYYRCKAGNLDLIEGIHYEWSDDVFQNQFYYYDSSLQNRELTEKEYYEMDEELEHKYNRPKFQLHPFKDSL